MNKIKTLLMISYGFPPAGGAGVKRIIKFLKFLPEYGWNCVVLTVKNGNFSIYDKTLLQEIREDTPVYRAYTLESLFNKGIKHTSGGIGSTTMFDKSLNKGFSINRLIKHAYKKVGEYVKITDSMILWVPGAMVSATKIMSVFNVDAIYSSGPSFTNFPVAVLLKNIFKKPVILDFRDAWMGDPMLVQNRKGYLLKINQRLEKYVVENSDRVISTNSFVTEDFRNRYPSDEPRKYDTLYNGYDTDDFPDTRQRSKEAFGKFHIVYTGRLYHERTPKYFLQAIREAFLEYPTMKKNLQVTFVGSCEKFMDGKYIGDYLEEYGLGDVVKLTGHVSRNESLDYEKSADLLLVLIGIVPQYKEMTYGISGKIFDYMIAGKTILTLANGGASREFITCNCIGPIYFHEDIMGVRNYLIDAYKKHQIGDFKAEVDLDKYKEFNFRSITGQLAKHLDEMIHR